MPVPPGGRTCWNCVAQHVAAFSSLRSPLSRWSERKADRQVEFFAAIADQRSLDRPFLHDPIERDPRAGEDQPASQRIDVELL
jgi:hypothetical protein